MDDGRQGQGAGGLETGRRDQPGQRNAAGDTQTSARQFVSRRAVAFCLLGGLALSGCATRKPPVATPAVEAAVRTGRLAVRVDTQPTQAFSAGFELRGNAETGLLLLFSPFGGTLARLSWSPGEARLLSDGKEQTFASFEALSQHVTGASLPLGGLFQWLARDPAPVEGWQAELGELAEGRLHARRITPAPTVDLRVVLD
ncbi:MAG: outer membrane lipoprotein LolB [Burkholderiaceae bacterium]